MAKPNPKEFKRYSLVLPMEIYRELEALINEKKTTVVDGLKVAIRLLIVLHAYLKQDAKIYAELPNGERIHLIIPW